MVEGKQSFVTGAYFRIGIIGESRGGRFLVTADDVWVWVSELRNDSQGNFLAACKLLGDKARVPWFHAHRGPYPRVGQEDRSPILADVCERGDLLCVFSGTVINSKIENPCQKF